MPDQTDAVTSSTADVKPAAENKPMTEEAFLASRLASHKARAERSKPKAEPESGKGESSSTAVPKEGATGTETPSPAVLSKDIEDLTDEEISELAQKGKSGLLKRIAELTARRKLAEEKAAQMEAALQRQAHASAPAVEVENNPFAGVKNPEEFKTKVREVEEVIEWSEGVLDKADDARNDDIVATVDGREYSKASIKDILRRARKSQKTYLPARWQELQQDYARTYVEEQFRQQARKEIPWLNEDGNEVRKEFDKMVADPRLKKLRETVPDLAPQIEYLVAHAANSMFSRKSIPIEQVPAKPNVSPASQSSPKLTPTPSPAASAAPSERVEGRDDSDLKTAEERFQKTGRQDDYIALRTAQILKRRKIA